MVHGTLERRIDTKKGQMSNGDGSRSDNEALRSRTVENGVLGRLGDS